MDGPAVDLVFPETWSAESRERFQRLADMGKITQLDVDRIEAFLVWFRNVRDEFARQSVTTISREQ